MARRIVQSPAQTPNKQAMRLGESASHPCPSLELLITSVLLRDSVRRKVLTSASLCSLGPLFQQNGRWTRGNRVEFVNIGQCSCSGSTVQRTLDLADLRPDLPHFFGLGTNLQFFVPAYILMRHRHQATDSYQYRLCYFGVAGPRHFCRTAAAALGAAFKVSCARRRY